MALSHTEIKVELREISLKDRPKQLIAISSKGTVPVIQFPTGKTIDESLDIMIWSLKTEKSTQKKQPVLSQAETLQKIQIDLRGKRVEEGLHETEKF